MLQLHTWLNVAATFERLMQLCIIVYIVRNKVLTKLQQAKFRRNITSKGLVGKTLTNHYPYIKIVKPLCHMVFTTHDEERLL